MGGLRTQGGRSESGPRRVGRLALGSGTACASLSRKLKVGRKLSGCAAGPRMVATRGAGAALQVP